MLSRLTGILESIDPPPGQHAISDATIVPTGSPLAYAVMLPAYLAQRLQPRLGQTVTLHTLHYFEGQLGGSNLVPRLVGFASPHERRFFELLTSVDGVGNRKALRALAQEPALIARAIAAADAHWLTQLPEIGKKTAEKAILELKSKVAPFLTDAELTSLNAAAITAPLPAAGIESDAIAALVALGESRPEAERKIRAARAKKPKATTPDELVAAAFGA